MALVDQGHKSVVSGPSGRYRPGWRGVILVSMTLPLRVLVADSNPHATAGLTLELRSIPHVCLLGIAADEEQVTDMVSGTRPDAVILDPRHLASDPVALVRRLTSAVPGIRIIVLTAYVLDREHEALRAAGARAVVLKDINQGALPSALFD